MMHLIPIYTFLLCSDVIGIGPGKIWKDSEFSMLPTYKKLFTAGLRIWVFR